MWRATWRSAGGGRRRLGLAVAVAFTLILAFLAATAGAGLLTSGPNRPRARPRPFASPAAAPAPARAASDTGPRDLPGSDAPTPTDLHDPLAVAGAVASAIYRSPGLQLPPSVLSAHARRLLDALATRSRRPATASPSSAQLLDPRATAVLVQVDVVRWWVDTTPPAADPTPHLVRLTLFLRPGGSWAVDDIQALS